MRPLLLVLLAACTGATQADTAPDTASCADAHDVDWYSFGDGFFATWCRSCHSAEVPYRYGAPEGVDFDTEEQVRALAPSIRRSVIEEETMPVGGGVLEDDLILLDEYLRCGL